MSRHKLGEIAIISIGGTPSRNTPKYWAKEQDGYPWVAISDLNPKSKFISTTSEQITDEGVKHSNVKLIPRGTLLMSFKLSIGRVAITGMELYTNEAIAAFQPLNESFDTNYLYYSLPTADYSKVLDTAIKGATLNKQKLKELELDFPPLPVQRKIAYILSTVDRQIEKTEQLIRKYEMVKEGMMQDLFTRGIDVKTGKLRTSYDEAPGLYKESELGWIPKEWESDLWVNACNKVFVGIATSTVKHFVDEGNGVPLVRNQNILENKLQLDDLLYISPIFADMNKSKYIKHNDILTIRTGYPGLSCLAPQSAEGWQSFTTLISRVAEEFNPQYLVHFINSNKGRTQIMSKQGGGAQQNLNVSWLNTLIVYKPSLIEQRCIVERIQLIYELIRKEKDALSNIQSLKIGLMQDLLTGKIIIN